MTIEMRLLPGAGTRGHLGEAFDCAYTPDGGWVLSGGRDGRLTVWEVTSGRSLTSLEVCDKPLSACASSPDGSLWVVGTMDGLLSVWDSVNHEEKRRWLPHTRPISSLRFSPDGHWLASASWDRTISLHSFSDPENPHYLHGHTDLVNGCRFSPDGQWLLTWSNDCSLRFWDVESGECEAVLQEHTDSVSSAAYSDDQRWLATASRDAWVVIWDLEEQDAHATIQQDAEICGVFFLPGSEHVVTVDANGLIVLMRVPDLEPLKILPTEHGVTRADLSPAGNRLALACTDGLVRFLTLEGITEAPLVVVPRQSYREVRSSLNKIFGGTPKCQEVYLCLCPACLQEHEVQALSEGPVPCPHCSRALRYGPPVEVEA